jgi:tetratricopeptide (TPR) repeat protein
VDKPAFQPPANVVPPLRQICTKLGMSDQHFEHYLNCRNPDEITKYDRVVYETIQGHHGTEIALTFGLGNQLGNLSYCMQHPRLYEAAAQIVPSIRQSAAVDESKVKFPQELFDALDEIESRIQRADFTGAVKVLEQLANRCENPDFYLQAYLPAAAPESTPRQAAAEPPAAPHKPRRTREILADCRAADAGPPAAPNKPRPVEAPEPKSEKPKPTPQPRVSVSQDRSETAQEFMENGKKASAEGNKSEAFQWFDKAVRLNPNLAEAWFWRGTYLQADKEEMDMDCVMESLSNHKRAAELDENFKKMYDSRIESLRLVTRNPHFGDDIEASQPEWEEPDSKRKGFFRRLFG